ncbi:hypothetical protein O6H91_01G047800 [Diphasiastrum complanatum]|uniref:Uncharacterized protein n=1 Tax=Diphasiastrum complanatum TaxID=34168 RepID=A0ACC2EQQ1_DIPCM|nr:hypothetical protein O6H91_01G047800 [Diphasiastrum complanatum]
MAQVHHSDKSDNSGESIHQSLELITPAVEQNSEHQSPIEQVALTVSTADDLSMPVWTFRMWTIGLAS